MQKFQLGTFSQGGNASFAGIVTGEEVRSLDSVAHLVSSTGHGLHGTESMLAFMQDWKANFAALQEAVATPGFSSLPATAISQLTVEAPLRPQQILCAGANYREHTIEIMMNEDPGGARAHLTKEERRTLAEQEVDERSRTGAPYLFIKTAAALNRADAQIVLPFDVEKPDWELELAIVIGRKAWRVKKANAFDYVAGYTVANDLSARDRQYRTDVKILGADWLAGKGAPGFLPLGPLITPKAFVPNAEKLALKLTLNGQTMQDSNTDDMIFGIARLIEYASNLTELWPGDVILTGSPPGNAAHHNRWIQPGDVMEGEIEGLGKQRLTFVAEEGGQPEPSHS